MHYGEAASFFEKALRILERLAAPGRAADTGASQGLSAASIACAERLVELGRAELTVLLRQCKSFAMAASLLSSGRVPVRPASLTMSAAHPWCPSVSI